MQLRYEIPIEIKLIKRRRIFFLSLKVNRKTNGLFAHSLFYFYYNQEKVSRIPKAPIFYNILLLFYLDFFQKPPDKEETTQEETLDRAIVFFLS